MMAVKSGRAIPPRFLEPPPEVQSGLGIFMRAYFDLAADRSESGRIPWSTVDRWCHRKGLDGDEANDAQFLIQRMDMAYLEWVKKKAPTRTPPTPLPKKDDADGLPTRVRR